MRFLVFFIGVCLVMGACVPNRKIVYMQKDDVNKSGFPKDTVVRFYDVEQVQYKVQTGDLLYVEFQSITPSEYDFLSRERLAANIQNLNNGAALIIGELVDISGAIPFPVVGKVTVAGQSVFEIEDKLQKLANNYFESPIVKVRLINFRITVLGEVNREGLIHLNNNRVSMLEALGLAGGLTDLADRSTVKLIRQQGARNEVIYLDLLKEDFFNSPYYYVHQNDVLIVPALKQRPFRKYFGQNVTLVVSTLSLLLLAINLSR